jgi:hypothetical protein
MITLSSPGRLLFATAFTCLLVATAGAQVDLEGVGPTVSSQFIEKQLAELQNSGLEISVRDRAAEIYRRTLANIESARADREAAVTAKLADIEQRIETEHQRPIESRKRLIAASEESGRIAFERAESPIVGEAPVLEDARRWMLRARGEALRAEIAMLDQAMFTQPQRLELLEAQRYATATNLNRVQQRANMLKVLLSERRRAETREIVASADIEAIPGASRIPGVNALQEANRKSGEELLMLTTALEAIGDRIELNQRRINDVESRRESLRLRLTPGTSGADVSRMLAEQRRACQSSMTTVTNPTRTKMTWRKPGYAGFRLGGNWRNSARPRTMPGNC